MNSNNEENAGLNAPAAPASQDDGIAAVDTSPPAASDSAAPTAESQAQPAADNAVEEQHQEIEPWPATKNVQQDAAVFAPLPKDYKVTISIAVPSTTEKRTEQILNRYPNVDFTQSDNGQRWINTLQQAQVTLQYGDGFRSTVDRPDGSWRQFVPSEKGPLTVGVPKFKETGTGTWTGERAMLRIRALTGLGSIVQIPLWHSGFWITLKAPTEAAMLELNRRLTEEKIRLGRSTHGLAFANTSVFYAGWITDFVLAHIYETSLKPEVLEKKPLRELISVLDVPALAWGLACTIWPKGFAYARSVLDTKGEETKIIRELINVGKLQWTDLSSLTPWQVGHMAARHGGTMSQEVLDRYKSDFTRGTGRRVKFSDQVSIMLKVPSLEAYLLSGQKWINNIVSSVDKAFSLTPGSDQREQYIVEQGKATNMRQYGHWVESVVVQGEENENVIDDLETVELTLDALSANDEFRGQYFKEVRQYIEDSTISVIAVPATEKEDEDRTTMPRFPHLLPIDALSVFFTLLVQKSLLIQDR